MTIKERILYQISEATEPGRMTQEEALRWFYYISGFVKVATLIVSRSFAKKLLYYRWEIVAIGRLIEAINEEKSCSS